MNYKTALANHKNVTIKPYSPLKVGQNARYSEWTEIDYGVFNYLTIKYRILLIRLWSDQATQVWVKPATLGGRLRVWVK